MYTGTSVSVWQAVALSPTLPGDVVSFDLAAGQALKLSRGAFLVGSPGVRVTGAFNWRGLLGVGQQEGAFLSKVQAPDDAPAHVVASGFGIVERHDVPEGASFIVNNERFFACDAGVQYELSSIGGVKSFLFGGEGFVMKFRGPCVVWTQSRGPAQFAAALGEYLPKSGGNGPSWGGEKKK